MCGDNTMLDQIERKRTLCMEIRSRQHPFLQRNLERPPADRGPSDRAPADRAPEKSQCKQQSSPALPGWEKSNGASHLLNPSFLHYQQALANAHLQQPTYFPTGEASRAHYGALCRPACHGVARE
jgi:hypothetical protein